MQLSDRSGIACDSCGIVCKDDFVYYSFDFHNVHVYNNQRPSIDSIIRSEVVKSLDICTSCFDSIKDAVIKNYSKTMTPRRTNIANMFTVCEITGVKLSGNYEYYYCVVSKVNVRLSGQSYICVKCKSKSIGDRACAKCSGTQFTRVANTNVDNRHVEIVMCADAYNNLVARAGFIHKSVGKWSTAS